jgi:serine protease
MSAAADRTIHSHPSGETTMLRSQNGRRSRTRRPVRLLPALAALMVAVGAGACDADRTDSLGPTAPDMLTSGGEKTVLVGFTTEPGPVQVARIEAVGGEVTHSYRHIPVLAVRITGGLEATIAAQPGVAYVEDDIPMIPLGGKQITDWGVSRVDAPGAWALGHTGRGVKVGIFDSGIDLQHRDLKVAGGIDLVGDGRGLHDCQGHGTHVAGIVAARRNGHHTVGVAPDVELYSMRFADCDWAGATLAKMIQGIEWAMDARMDVVNMSFGFGLVAVSSPTLVPPSQAADAVFTAAFAAGVVLIGASGNSSTPYVGYPASYDAVIAVGATDDQDDLASFSQFGTAQELTAPGVNNLAPYLVGLGQETTLTVDTDGGQEVEAVAMEFAGKTGRKGITAPLVDAGFGSIAEFLALDCTGRIAIITRGVGTFAILAENAMNAGCAAAIIHNNQPGSFNGTLGEPTTSDGRPWIPVVSTTLAEGLYLKGEAGDGAAVGTLLNVDGNLAILSGTSMAAPHAAGVAALIRSARPGVSAAEVRRILRESAEDLGAPGWDPVYGYGLVNAERAVRAP